MIIGSTVIYILFIFPTCLVFHSALRREARVK